MSRAGLLAAVLATLAGCASSAASWTDQDTTAAVAKARLERAIVDACSPGPDGGPAVLCTPDNIEAAEKSGLCNSAAMLFRHGVAFDAGSGCGAPE